MPSPADPMTSYLDRLLKELPVDTTAQMLVTVHRLKQLHEELVNGPNGMVGGVLPRLLQPEGTGDLLFYLARTQVEQLKAISDFTQGELDRVFREARAGVERRRPEKEPPRHELRLTGVQGSTVNATPPPRVTNRAGGPVQVSWTSTELRGEDNKPSAGLVLEAGFKSEKGLDKQARLGPGKTTPFFVRVRIGPDVPVGNWYGTIDVKARKQVIHRIELELDVTARSG